MLTTCWLSNSVCIFDNESPFSYFLFQGAFHMYIIFKILFHHKERSVLDLSGPFVKQSKLRMTVKEKLPVVNSPGVCV